MLKILRLLLFPLSILYGVIAAARNILYDMGIFRTYDLNCRVISVGNLAVGGTGKTPFTIYLAHKLSDSGRSFGILSRGYGRSTSGTLIVSDGAGTILPWEKAGDEPVMMAHQLPTVPVVVDEDRVRGGRELISRFGVEIILLDDAFQHRRINRDVDLVLLVDNGSGTGLHRLIPSGNLRETFSGIKRASAVIFSRSNLNPPSERLKKRVNSCGLPSFETRLEPGVELIGLNEQAININEIRNSPAFLLAGIGDPRSFRALAVQSGFIVAGYKFYRDHHRFTENDLLEINAAFNATGAKIILTTEKDLIRLRGLDPSQSVYALPVLAAMRKDSERELLKLISG